MVFGPPQFAVGNAEVFGAINNCHEGLSDTSLFIRRHQRVTGHRDTQNCPHYRRILVLAKALGSGNNLVRQAFIAYFRKSIFDSENWRHLTTPILVECRKYLDGIEPSQRFAKFEEYTKSIGNRGLITKPLVR